MVQIRHLPEISYPLHRRLLHLPLLAQPDFAFLLQNVGGHSSVKEVREDLGLGLSSPKGGNPHSWREACPCLVAHQPPGHSCECATLGTRVSVVLLIDMGE